ncbi:MAG: Protein TolB [Planctomycetes bacterium ADurb.Bin126]|nr:MAG: Protein TolB [Planctomycetes bacterium ADurb.Bin126]HQL75781.1 hypothetical protein [Phycisphaerae bacterium]
MMNRFAPVGLCLLALATVLRAAPKLPENLAPKATVTANSEYHPKNYGARNVADGKIPGPGSQAQDVGAAWCVKGDTNRNGAELAFTWPVEIPLAEIHYWGRVGWYAEECWKGYEVYLDAASAPAARGELKMGFGPQPIKLPVGSKARTLRIKFTSSYGGFNPGAAEVQIFSQPADPAALAKFIPLHAGTTDAVAAPPPVIPETPELKAMIAAGRLGFDKLVLIHRRAINPTHVYTQHNEGFGPGGGLYVLSIKAEGNDLKQIVDSPTGQILDCDVSYDGREILFSWRKTPELPYHLYVVNADGTELRQITEGPHHNYNGCWLPDGAICFLSTRDAQFAYCWTSPVGVVCRIERDGHGFRRLSGNYLNDFTPAILDNGRIIYGRWEYVDRPAIPIQSLWTLNPDGTQLSVFFGNRVLSPATFIEPRSIPGTTKVLCTMTAHNGPCRGAIGILDPALGVNAQEAIVNLTPEINIGQVDKGSGNHVRGPFENPYPIDQEFFLVSRQGTVILRDYAGKQQATVIAGQGGLGFYSPQPLRVRQRPPVLASQLPERMGGDQEQWATVVLQDVYRGLEPHVQRGQVKQVRVVQEMKKAVRADVGRRAFGFQFPVISCGATYACKKVWGHAAVAEDGSACFRVPAGVPIYFEALDEHGMALQRMRSFTHLMPGEVQGCIGCHEPREQTSPPIRPAATAGQAMALEVPEWGGPTGFCYATHVQPVLDKYCVKCHSGPTPPNKVDLSGDKTDFFNVSYESLARGRKRLGREGEWDSPYVSWIPSYNGMEQNILQITPRAWGSPASKLGQVLLSGHPDKEGKPRLAGMDDAAKRRVYAWMDLNVPYYGTSETAYPNNRGCRHIYPQALDKTLADVAKRRCEGCHAGGNLPRPVWTRITNPRLNSFLTAPLAKDAGGSGACGQAVFKDVSDADYQAILKTFEPVAQMLADNPRMDMPGAKPSPAINRSCQ